MFRCNATTYLDGMWVDVAKTTRVTSILLCHKSHVHNLKTKKGKYFDDFSGLPCNDPQPLERHLELLDSDLEDKTVKVELCSNGEIVNCSEKHISKTNFCMFR